MLAEHDEGSVKLTSREEALLEQALRRGEDLREQVETNVTACARWLLEGALLELGGWAEREIVRERASNSSGFLKRDLEALIEPSH